MAGRHGVNAVHVGVTELLLTTTSGGEAVHLTRPQEPPLPGRGAVHDYYFDSADDHYALALQNYDRDELLKPRWAETTMCGRVWAVMIGGEGGSLSRYREVAFAPTCRRCLALMDGYFPKPAVDQRLSLVAQLTADIVCERGCAEVRRVPGDQQAALRKAVRGLIRERTGHGSQTFVRNDQVHVVCEAVYDQHALEHSRAAAEAIEHLLFGDGRPRPMPPQDWVVWWDAWDLGP